MAKRISKPKQPTPPSSALERQVLAFAEQLGYVAGSIESKVESRMDRQKLSRQVTSVRDGAKRLLEQLASGVASRVRRRAAPKRPVRKARSGGTVDAPGKKHRKPAPAAPPPAGERARNANMQAATHISKRRSHLARQG
ncbi:MAG TPA: hypothetical protein VFD69_21250 [Vicinamibacterales bacterium]|nr:hypothetical protein [Vicinamibacterales bacterium]